jgi:hypothetical protein
VIPNGKKTKPINRIYCKTDYFLNAKTQGNSAPYQNFTEDELVFGVLTTGENEAY